MFVSILDMSSSHGSTVVNANTAVSHRSACESMKRSANIPDIDMLFSTSSQPGAKETRYNDPYNMPTDYNQSQRAGKYAVLLMILGFLMILIMTKVIIKEIGSLVWQISFSLCLCLSILKMESL